MGVWCSCSGAEAPGIVMHARAGARSRVSNLTISRFLLLLLFPAFRHKETLCDVGRHRLCMLRGPRRLRQYYHLLTTVAPGNARVLSFCRDHLLCLLCCFLCGYEKHPVSIFVFCRSVHHGHVSARLCCARRFSAFPQSKDECGQQSLDWACSARTSHLTREPHGWHYGQVTPLTAAFTVAGSSAVASASRREEAICLHLDMSASVLEIEHVQK